MKKIFAQVIGFITILMFVLSIGVQPTLISNPLHQNLAEAKKKDKKKKDKRKKDKNKNKDKGKGKGKDKNKDWGPGSGNRKG